MTSPTVLTPILKRGLTSSALSVLLLLALSQESAASGAFDAWTYRMKVAVPGYSKSETLTNFPVLVALSNNVGDSQFSYGGFSFTNGADLRFAASNETDALNYEIEKWDTTGLSHVWVQVPQIAGPDDFIYAYWGKGDATAPACTTNGSTWSNGFIGVWHMSQTNAQDSTVNRAHATSVVGVTNVTGVIDGADAFAGTTNSGYLIITNYAPLEPAKVTVSAWMKWTGAGTHADGNHAVSKGRSGTSGWMSYSLRHRPSDNRFAASVSQGSNNELYDTAATPSNTFAYVSATFESGSFKFYRDGIVRASSTLAGSINYTMADHTLHLGDWNYLTFYRRFQGVVDEVQISGVVRSSNWVWACWANQVSNSTFVACSEAGPVSSVLAVGSLAPANIGLTNATLSGRVIQTGNMENPAVSICWADTDADTNSGTSAWGQVESLGTNWGAGQNFGTNVMGLLSGSTYVYRCYATNSTGFAWSGAQTFTTIYLPSVTNLGTINTYTSNVLQAQVLDTGENTPTTWFSYWADGSAVTTTVAMGTQTGAFSTVLTWLTPQTLYHYQAAASNLAGTVWSDVNDFSCLASNWYVTTNGNDGALGTDWSTALATISNAIARAMAGDTITVSNGTYAITNQLSITNRIILRSANDRPDLTVIDAGDVLGRRVLLNTTATISGFTLRRGRFNGNGGSVWMSGGMLTNCTVSDGNGGTGGGIYMTGGLVTHCVISNNSAGLVSYVPGGGGVYVSGGVLENSLIVSNSSGWGGGGIYSAGGLVRNCLIRKNMHLFYSYGGGGVYLGGGTLLNCTVVENRAEKLVGGVYVASGRPVTNCVVWNNICNTPGVPTDMSTNAGAFTCSPDLVGGTNGNTSANPLFLDQANGNFRLSLASPCRNTGANAANIGAVDLDDAARLYTGDGVGIVDMGAYEVGASGSLQCDFSGIPVAGPAPLQVVFNSAVSGPDTDNLHYAWDFDNSGSVETQGVGLVCVTNTYAAGLYSVKLTVSNAVGIVANRVRSGYVVSAPATVYVSTNGSSAIPYDTWETAATNPADALTMIQQSGGTMLLSNGVYTVGAEMILAKDITLRGVSGWSNTVIQRASGSFRLFSLMHSNAMLDGLTLANGAPGYDGGCVWMNGGTLTNCLVRGGTAINGGGVTMTRGLITHSVISNNSANGTYTSGGGGVYMSGGVLENSLILTNSTGNSGAGVNCAGGLVRNCLIQRNKCPYAYGNASAGGGAAVSGGGVLMNCTIVENSAYKDGGGVFGQPATNCIIWYNSCDTTAKINNIGTNAAAFSCSPDLTGGLNNTDANPLFVDQSNGNYRLSPSSPCINAGTNAANVGASDLDDSLRIYTGDGGIVDMGCYELGSVSTLFCDFNSSPYPAAGLAPLQVTFNASVSGPNTNDLYYWWDFDNNGSVDAQGSDKRVVATNFSAGLYTVKLTVSNQVGTVTNMTRAGYVLSAPPIVYVATNGTAAVPYDTWSKAATNLSDAVTFQQSGGAVWVSNGAYTAGAEMVLEKGITVRGVSGPSETVVQRASGSFRLFTLMDTNAVLDGLTIANGSSSGNGGCVWMNGGTLTNCIVRGGAAANGGGVYMGGGLITHCAISNNNGSGSYTSGGGGVYMTGGVLENSLIGSNTTANSGGGVNCAGGLARNCLILRNVAPTSGGNASAGGGAAVSGGGLLLNCTVVANRAYKTCGGVVGQPATNCIVWNNTCDTPGATNNIGTGAAAFSCSPDLAGGLNNTTNDPRFVSVSQGSYRLLGASPCKDTGANMAWMSDATDLDGQPRISGGRVDMGAYESMPCGSAFLIR